MNTYYELVSMFYDNGKLTIIINEIRADEKPKDNYYRLNHYTFREYFYDLQSAKNRQNKLLKANNQYYDCYCEK